MGILCWIIPWTQYNLSKPYKRDLGGTKVRGEDDVITAAETGMMVHFQDGGRSYKPIGQEKPKKLRKLSLPSETPALLTP